MLADGTFIPLFKEPYLIVNIQVPGVTADIRSLATGHMATVKRRRLKVVEAILQHALHLKGLRGPYCARYFVALQPRSRHRCAQTCRLVHTCMARA